MKKLVIFTLLISLAVISIARPLNTFGFHIKCLACKERAIETNFTNGCQGCHAWRMYNLEMKEEYKNYYVYHCPHGHELLVPKDNPTIFKVLNLKTNEYKTIEIPEN